MDQITHNVRRANWLTVITNCQHRPEGISVKQWLSDNGVKEKAYYYWLRKIRKETYEQIQSSVENSNTCNNNSEIAFAEITVPEKISQSCIMPPATACEKPVAVIRYREMAIELSDEISDSLLSRILREVSNA